MKKLVILRRITQIFCFVLFVYILWSTTYPLKGILPPDTFFKINPFIIILTSISERIVLPGILLALLMLLLTLVLGRFFCGWVCPLGTMTDFCGCMKAKRKGFSTRQRLYSSSEVEKIKALPRSNNKLLPSIKYYILGGCVFFSFLGIQIAWIFDPIVISARFVSLNLIPTLTLGIDKAFILFIKLSNFHQGLYDFYRFLKSTVLGVKVYYFSHSLIIFIFFLIIVGLVLVARRFWCRTLCPLGAMYALVARFSLLRRVVDECISCLKCKINCRMDAIKEDMSYLKEECILCMDCIYDCPAHKTSFKFPTKDLAETIAGGVTRREFLFLIFSPIFLKGLSLKAKVIRPPASLKEEAFLDRCIRCGNCMKVCITNGLQPVIFESGITGVWTPQLVPEIGYCEYSCTLCGNVCPTGAIARLSVEEKHRVRLGIAEVNRSTCIAWAYDKECIVCQEHCPVPTKAIKLIKGSDGTRAIDKPIVEPSLCIGCGICQNKCPTMPERAIKVLPIYSTRT